MSVNELNTVFNIAAGLINIFSGTATWHSINRCPLQKHKGFCLSCALFVM